ncbi:MAG: hypothetical protein J6X97_04405 [Lachnospiraceae bacterium]|nr:hypothetical protein [Lachnospiraceae bacterium]
MSIDFWRFLYKSFFVLTGILSIVTVFLYFYFDVGLIIRTISGRKERDELKKIRENNRRRYNSIVGDIYKKETMTNLNTDSGNKGTVLLNENATMILLEDESEKTNN